MRVTGGAIGRRRLRVPPGAVRPTQDRVRQALFSALGAQVAGCRFLDLFAGSGAVGLEAWSRGAARVVWVEQDGRTCRVLKENVTHLCRSVRDSAQGAVRVVRADVWRFIGTGANFGPFDLIFADPPYDRTGGQRWLERLLAALAKASLLAPAGIFIIEQSRRGPAPRLGGWRLLKERGYGETVLRFLCGK